MHHHYLLYIHFSHLKILVSFLSLNRETFIFRQSARTRGTPAPSVSVVLPKGITHNRTTKTVTAPVVTSPDKECQRPINDLDNKEETPINALINLNIDDESPNIAGDDEIIDFQNLYSPNANVTIMGNVNLFAAARSTQGALTILGDEMSENEFELSPKPREPGLKTTGCHNSW